MYFFYYIPVGINDRLTRFPAMTMVYAMICALVFVLARYFSHITGLDFYNLIYVPDQANLLVAMAAAFLHFGYIHLIGNMLYLVLFGRYVEDRMGPVLFTFLFLSSAAVGNYAQGLFNTHVLGDPYIGIIGASGAISGMLGAFAVRFIHSKVAVAFWVFMPLQAYTRAGKQYIPAVLAIALWFGIQLARGLVQTGGADTQVAYVTHIAGFLWGVGVAAITGQWREGRIESMLRRGDEYMRKSESYAAQGCYLRYLTHRPDEPQPYESLARAMVLSGNEAAAQKNYRKACELYLDQQRRGKAEMLYQEALRGFPDFVLSVDSHLNLAFGLERNLKTHLAICAYDNFVDSYPKHADAPFTLLRSATLYWRTLDKPVAAEMCYRRLVDRYPRDAWVDFATEQLRLLSFQTSN
jgi:membrane associated rhomboid family serine protease